MRLLLGLISMFFLHICYAFTCYLTLLKEDCWKNYAVTVQVMDSIKNNNLLTITVPQGKMWTRLPFNCTAGQNLMYSAKFSPIFWQSEKNTQYMAKKFWVLPKVQPEKAAAWEIPVCFAQAFSGVPFPPDAVSTCKCDFTIIPVLIMPSDKK